MESNLLDGCRSRSPDSGSACSYPVLFEPGSRSSFDRWNEGHWLVGPSRLYGDIFGIAQSKHRKPFEITDQGIAQ